MAVLLSSVDLFALATLATRADEAGGPPPTKFYELRDNLRAGEAARIIALHQRAGTSRAQSTGTVVIERAYDLLSLLVRSSWRSPGCQR